MNVFDRFIVGDTENIDWCFENTHFNRRLSDNGISREFIVDCVMNEEPISYERLEGNKYAVVFKAPPSKDYKEIRVVFACNGDKIDLVTIMRNNETTTNRQNKQYQSEKKKSIEKKRIQAIKKRKW